MEAWRLTCRGTRMVTGTPHRVAQAIALYVSSGAVTSLDVWTREGQRVEVVPESRRAVRLMVGSSASSLYQMDRLTQALRLCDVHVQHDKENDATR